MSDDKTIQEWRKYRRQSIQALPWCFASLVLVSGVLFVINLFIPVPLWLTSILIGVSAFSVVGDATNIIYLNQKLRKADHHDNAKAPENHDWRRKGGMLLFCPAPHCRISRVILFRLQYIVTCQYSGGIKGVRSLLYPSLIVPPVP